MKNLVESRAKVYHCRVDLYAPQKFKFVYAQYISLYIQIHRKIKLEDKSLRSPIAFQ